MRQIDRMPKGAESGFFVTDQMFRCPLTEQLTYWSLAQRRTITLRDARGNAVRQVSIAMSIKGALAFDAIMAGPDAAECAARLLAAR